MQIGNDPEAAASLAALDDDLKGSRDMVDTVAHSGTLSAAFIEKALLGPHYTATRLMAQAL